MKLLMLLLLSVLLLMLLLGRLRIGLRLCNALCSLLLRGLRKLLLALVLKLFLGHTQDCRGGAIKTHFVCVEGGGTKKTAQTEARKTIRKKKIKSAI